MNSVAPHLEVLFPASVDLMPEDLRAVMATASSQLASPQSCCWMRTGSERLAGFEAPHLKPPECLSGRCVPPPHPTVSLSLSLSLILIVHIMIAE